VNDRLRNFHRALHESGHCVAVIYGGGGLDSVSLNPDRTHCRVKSMSAESIGVVAVAGMIACRLYGDLLGRDAAMSSADVAMLAQSGVDRATATLCATQLLRRRRASVLAVADALVVHGRLDGSEASRLATAADIPRCLPVPDPARSHSSNGRASSSAMTALDVIDAHRLAAGPRVFTVGGGPHCRGGRIAGAAPPATELLRPNFLADSHHGEVAHPLAIGGRVGATIRYVAAPEYRHAIRARKLPGSPIQILTGA